MFFAMLRQIDVERRSTDDLQGLVGPEGFPLNTVQISDQAQLLLIGHVIPGGFMTESALVWLRSQPDEFHARRLETKRAAARKLLDGKEFAHFYAGNTLFIVRKDVDVPDYFPVDINVYGPSAGPSLERLSALELRCYNVMRQTGKVTNSPALARYLTIATIVQDNIVGNSDVSRANAEFFNSPHNHTDGGIKNPRAYIFCVEPRGEVGVGGVLLFKKSMVCANPDAVFIVKGSKMLSMAGTVRCLCSLCVSLFAEFCCDSMVRPTKRISTSMPWKWARFWATKGNLGHSSGS
jgi:hypothetical protein